MTTNESHQAALYIDRKADYARRQAKRNPNEAEVWQHVARILDNTADEIQLGLHMKEHEDVADN